ncbi:hypothetical protein WJX72_010315 [[Myrmecia] bisecta]|uniref:CobW/HypB/UreG nucleotide-binding domain-containing protein n=1 Tax=[Myrmecia] bisecta TaxID=41462 RepID=A0AAW1QSI3_9CHLO
MEMSVDDAGDMTVAINSVIITKADLLNAPNNAKEVMLDDETAVVIELYREHFGHSIHIITPVFDATFFATMPGLDDYYQEYLTAYLNFYMGLRDPSISAIHGLLGQTAPNSMASKPRSAIASSSASIELFNGEDQEADYIVDGPFATEYKFTQYGKPPTKQQVLKVARRSLLEHLQPTVFATMKLHA